MAVRPADVIDPIDGVVRRLEDAVEELHLVHNTEGSALLGGTIVGEHNEEDVRRGFECLDFMAEARPQGEEGVAEDSRQLFALCREAGVNHLVYAGFAINWCLLLSPGGMAEMSRHGIMCSALRQAVTAVENREPARDELAKQIGLWRVALAFGFVFDVDDFVGALGKGG